MRDVRAGFCGLRKDIKDIKDINDIDERLSNLKEHVTRLDQRMIGLKERLSVERRLAR